MPRFSISRSLSVVLTFASALSAQALDPGWTKLTPAPALPALSAMAIAWDPIGNDLVVFGGDGVGGYSDATWTFDGVGWTQRVTPVAPPARAAASMAFDPVSRKLVLFGGFDGAYQGDTWLWDGASASWSPAIRCPPRNCSTSPSRRPRAWPKRTPPGSSTAT